MIFTENEAEAMMKIFKNIGKDYNANNLSKEIKITPMGTLKILKKLEEQELLKSKKMGKATFYKINYNDYTKTALELFLRREAKQAPSRAKRWIKEFEQLKENADIAILFGSALKTDSYKDVDILITLQQEQNQQLNQQLKRIQETTAKEIHTVKQTTEDMEKNLKEKNKVILNAIKEGIVMFGYQNLIEAIENVT